MYQRIHDAHTKLIDAVDELAHETQDTVPITVVSMGETVGTQMVIFDGKNITKAKAIERLRLATKLLEDGNYT